MAEIFICKQIQSLRISPFSQACIRDVKCQCAAPLSVPGVPAPVPNNEPDKCVGRDSAGGKFNTAKAYLRIAKCSWDPPSSEAKCIWKLVAPQRVKSFLWLASKQRLMTNVNRAKRGLSDSTDCPQCNQAPETTLHVLRDCPWAQEVWLSALPSIEVQRFNSEQWEDWFRGNISKTDLVQESEVQWNTFFAIICWQIWKRRNKVVFNKEFIPSTGVVAQAWFAAKHMVEGRRREIIQANISPNPRRFSMTWKRPSEGWIKLNSDGARDMDTGWATAGGVIRNHLGQWICGYSKVIGRCSVIQAELWGCLTGLILAWEKGFRKVEIELDNTEAVALITGEEDEGGTCSLVRKIQHLCTLNWNWKCKHVFREANKVADAIARSRNNLDTLYAVLEEPPPYVLNYLAKDRLDSYDQLEAVRH